MSPVPVRTVVAAPLTVSVSLEASPQVTAPPDWNVKPSSVTSALNVAPPLSTVTSSRNSTAPLPAACVRPASGVPPPSTPRNSFIPVPTKVRSKPPLTVPL